MTAFLHIVRKPYEEPYHLNLLVSASDGSQRGELEIYANAEDLGTFASNLRQMPGGKREAIWELGSEMPEDRFAFYFRIRAHQISSSGECAIEFRFNNNESPPARQISEFSVRAMPSDLDRLAELLEGFGRLKHRVLERNVTSGELRG
jgi:hypothetical protein